MSFLLLDWSYPPATRASPSSARLALVGAGEFGRRQDMAFDRLLQFSLGSTGTKLELGVEGAQAKVIAVRAVARSRTGPAIASRAEVVSTLDRRRLAFPESACVRIETPSDPVRKNAAWRVRV